MNVLITGGTGFLGRHLVQRLLENDDISIRVMGRSPAPDLEAAGVEFVRGSVTDPKDVARAMKDMDAVYHLAGRVDRDRSAARGLHEVHVEGTRNILQQAATQELKRVVIASTSGTVGCSTDPNVIATEDSPYAIDVVGKWPYYLSKIYAEKEALKIAEDTGLEVVICMPSLLLGPGDQDLRSTGDIYRFLQRKFPAVLPGTINIVDVRDAADAFISAMEKGTSGAQYLLGGDNITIPDLMVQLEQVSGIKKPGVQLPQSVGKIAATVLGALEQATGSSSYDSATIDMGLHNWSIDSTLAMNEIDFKPRPLKITLEDTIEWLWANNPHMPSDDGITSRLTGGASRVVGNLFRFGRVFGGRLRNDVDEYEYAATEEE